VIIGSVLLVWFAVSRWSYSYDADGHFYTAVTIQQGRQPPFAGSLRDQAVLLAFCAQLPDLAKEYDAVSLRVRLIPSFTGSLWGAFSSCWGDEVCHMVTVHHYLHGLTDTKAEPVTTAAVEILKSLLKPDPATGALDANNVCAAGFAIHLLADSFAHRRLDSPEWMYAPGMGHYSDDHNPDFILYNKDGKDRTHLWSRFIKEFGAALSVNLDPTRAAALSAIIKQSLNQATLDNYFNEAELIAALRSTLKGPAGDQTSTWMPYAPPVEGLSARDSWLDRRVLQRSCQQVLDEYKISAKWNLNCNRIWNNYKQAAVREFKAQKIPAICRDV
jgi:hypothetical protein